MPEALRGTYLGLAHLAAIGHLKELGVTTVELLLVQAFEEDGALADRGLVNYSGYNTLAYFAPHPGYPASKELGAATRELLQMVGALHDAGLEVLLNVVYNHTWEGSHKGPTVSLRGLDNAAPSEESARYAMEFSGCGNCLDMRSPYALALVLDSLHYWAVDMRVDGFRFDLATALAREGSAPSFDTCAGFFAPFTRTQCCRASSSSPFSRERSGTARRRTCRGIAPTAPRCPRKIGTTRSRVRSRSPSGTRAA